MNSIPHCHGIIPARYGSTRFPAKALADILGKPMFWHVWKRASACPELLSVTLATDDKRIGQAADEHGVPWVMTATEHQSGTDRVCEAAELLGLPAEAVIANIQGDEPALEPVMLSELLRPFADPAVRVTTLARRISRCEAASADQVKVVLAAGGDALYFSRAAIPFDRDSALRCDKDGPAGAGGGSTGSHGCLGHIGLYAFRREALKIFTGLAPSRLERVEKLEQLRLLENGIPIRVAVTAGRSFGVDRPEDLARVIAILRAGRE